jgi:pimeloyl-ACP methyl ester carboxylesterase
MRVPIRVRTILMFVLVTAAVWSLGFDAVTAGPVLSGGFVESGGEQIYYETVGAGDVVVLNHGLGGNHAIWYQQVPVLAERFQVVTWDQRGFGRSTNAKGENSPAAAASDLAAVLDHLGIERAHLVGQSMGGWVVMGFALAHPDRARSIVLADTLGGIYTPEASAHFDAYIRDMMTQPSPDELPITRHPALGEQLGPADPAKAFLYRQIGGLGGPAPKNAGLQLRQTSYALDDVHKSKVPALFVVGENDPIFPPAVVRSVAGEVRGATVVELPGAGHSPYFETPETWNAAVLSFLGGIAE